jgi:N6-adenosine-specific RNA methylase IME4
MRTFELVRSRKLETVSNLEIDARALYLLAAPSTPDTSRDEALRRVSAGEHLRHADVRGIIKAHGEGAVLRAAKQIRAERTEERRTERFQALAEIAKGNTPLPNGKRYPVILADPPWFFETFTSAEAYDRAPQYPTMRLADICALPVPDLATDPAILFLWSTSAHLRLAFNVIEAWGFTYATSAVWVKTDCAPGLGHYFRQQHETLLIARRSDFPLASPETRPSSVIAAPRREHSHKPDEVYEIIEGMYPTLPRIELFARQRRPGWEVWGNEIAAEIAEAAE